MSVGAMKDQNIKLRNLHASPTLPFFSPSVFFFEQEQERNIYISKGADSFNYQGLSVQTQLTKRSVRGLFVYMTLEPLTSLASWEEERNAGGGGQVISASESECAGVKVRAYWITILSRSTFSSSSAPLPSRAA